VARVAVDENILRNTSGLMGDRVGTSRLLACDCPIGVEGIQSTAGKRGLLLL
jgi:hypothetical protein